MDTFYMFGGDSQWSTSIIAAFSTLTKQWKKMGELNTARDGHGVIIQRGEFIIIGGVETKKSGASPIVPMSTERCTLTGDKINCVDVGPWLTNYWSYPEIMHVPHDYCLK